MSERSHRLTLAIHVSRATGIFEGREDLFFLRLVVDRLSTGSCLRSKFSPIFYGYYSSEETTEIGASPFLWNQ